MASQITAKKVKEQRVNLLSFKDTESPDLDNINGEEDIMEDDLEEVLRAYHA